MDGCAPEMGPRGRYVSRMRALGIEIGSRELEMTREREIPGGRGEFPGFGTLSSPMQLMG